MDRERDPENQARIEAKWGKKGQRDEDFKIGRDGDRKKDGVTRTDHSPSLAHRFLRCSLLPKSSNCNAFGLSGGR